MQANWHKSICDHLAHKLHAKQIILCQGSVEEGHLVRSRQIDMNTCKVCELKPKRERTNKKSAIAKQLSGKFESKMSV